MRVFLWTLGARMTHPALSIVVQPDGSTVTLLLEGELDMASVETLRGCAQAIDRGFRTIVVDLERLTFIDSTGLNTLVAMHRRAEMDLGRVVVRSPRGLVLRVLEMSGIERVINVEHALAPGAPDPNDARPMGPIAV
jgi:stage II sporulation protein AA (anti-sigma F factor antagonist)